MSGRSERAKKARVALERSLDEQRLVHISRRLRHAEPVDGVVVASGLRWVLVNRLSPDLDLDGYTAVRCKHITKARVFGGSTTEARAVAGVEIRHFPTRRFDVTTTGALLASLIRAGVSVTIYDEKTDRRPWAVATVREAAAKEAHLTPLGPDRGRARSSITIPFDSITRIEFGTRRIAGLERAARSPHGEDGEDEDR